MADSGADTTTLVVVAAVIVVAVMWSRRGGMMYGRPATRPTAGGSSTSSDIISGVRDLFSGVIDAYKTTHSSDPNAGYMLPSSSTSGSSEPAYDDSSYGVGLSPGGSAVDPTCMDGYVGDDGIFVCTA